MAAFSSARMIWPMVIVEEETMKKLKWEEIGTPEREKKTTPEKGVTNDGNEMTESWKAIILRALRMVTTNYCCSSCTNWNQCSTKRGHVAYFRCSPVGKKPAGKKGWIHRSHLLFKLHDGQSKLYSARTHVFNNRFFNVLSEGNHEFKKKRTNLS